MKTNIHHLRQLYHDELFTSVLPFWTQHSIDAEGGGFFTCLLRDGQVFDTDKFIWLQARQTWMFAKLYEQHEPNAEWLEMSLHGARFLEKFGRAPSGDWYFSLTRDGKPLIQPYNIFSDCFAAMAFGQLGKITTAEKHTALAISTFNRILERQHDPKGIYTKSVEGTRPLKNFALPMILCNLCLELEPLLDQTLVRQTIDQCIHEVMEVFYFPGEDLILENVQPDGSFSDSFEGRLLNPGHAIEAMWFIMDLGVRNNDPILIQKAKDRALRMLEAGWDETYGGMLYFMDVKGYPPQQLEWDQKLWWVHLETLIALLKGYQLTRDPRCWDWFERVHDYTWSHFPDTEKGEWYGYLNRRGEVLLSLKGGKWKGCFHVPRGLWKCWQVLDQL